jgi:hypothetical protein
MAEKEFLRMLYVSHLADLNSVRPNGNNKFICPICLTEFSEEDIGNGNLTDGHVWPDYIREKSKSRVAAHQRVLLCKSCNNTSGSRGDRHMQLRERIKDADKAGKLFDKRRIKIITAPGETPIKLQATVSIQEGDVIEGQIAFPIDERTGQWLRNNPKEQEKFLAATQNNKFALVIEPQHELNSELSSVGWITSAYLLAFFTFGYRYILHSGLDIVRDYIIKSFDDEASANLRRPKSDNFGLTECKEHNFENPEIALVIPMDEKIRIHLEVSFLDYHIRLPFYFVPHVLQAMILNIPDVANQLPGLRGTETIMYSPIMGNKYNGRDFIWDYVLGKPIPT